MAWISGMAFRQYGVCWYCWISRMTSAIFRRLSKLIKLFWIMSLLPSSMNTKSVRYTPVEEEEKWWAVCRRRKKWRKRRETNPGREHRAGPGCAAFSGTCRSLSDVKPDYLIARSAPCTSLGPAVRRNEERWWWAKQGQTGEKWEMGSFLAYIPRLGESANGRARHGSHDRGQGIEIIQAHAFLEWGAKNWEEKKKKEMKK